MAFEKTKLEMELLGKSKEQRLRIASLAETKEHINEAFKECEDTISEGKIKGLECVCDKLQDRRWLDLDNVRVGRKLYSL